MAASKPQVQKISSHGNPSRQPSVIDISDEDENKKPNDAAESSESELS